MLFINADKLPTSCNQSESASANDSNLLYFENGHSTQPMAIWLYSGYLPISAASVNLIKMGLHGVVSAVSSLTC